MLERNAKAVRAMTEKFAMYIRQRANPKTKERVWGPLAPYCVRDIHGAPEKPYRGDGAILMADDA